MQRDSKLAGPLMTVQALFRPSTCCEGLSAVQGHGFIDEPRLVGLFETRRSRVDSVG